MFGPVGSSAELSEEQFFFALSSQSRPVGTGDVKLLHQHLDQETGLGERNLVATLEQTPTGEQAIIVETVLLNPGSRDVAQANANTLARIINDYMLQTFGWQGVRYQMGLTSVLDKPIAVMTYTVQPE